MDDEEYKITWFHMETTHKEDYRQLEYTCPKPKPPPRTCRNIVSHEHSPPTEPPPSKISIIQPDVLQEYCIQRNVSQDALKKHPLTLIPFTSEDMISAEEYTKRREENILKKTDLIEKCKFAVQLSAMTKLDTYSKVIEYAYKSNYKASFTVDGFQFKDVVFTADDYERRRKLKPPPSEPLQLLHKYLMPGITTWKTIQSNNTAALKDEARSQPCDTFPREKDKLGCQILLDARRKGVLSHSYTWNPHHGGTKRRNPPFPTNTNQVYRDYLVWHNPVDMSVMNSILQQAIGE